MFGNRNIIVLYLYLFWKEILQNIGTIMDDFYFEFYTFLLFPDIHRMCLCVCWFLKLWKHLRKLLGALLFSLLSACTLCLSWEIYFRYYLLPIVPPSFEYNLIYTLTFFFFFLLRKFKRQGHLSGLVG